MWDFIAYNPPMVEKSFFQKNYKKLLLIPLVVVTLFLFSYFKSLSNQAHPKWGPMVEAVYGIGTVTARHTYDMKLGVSDTLEKLYVSEGDSVKRGQALLALADGRTLRAPFDGVVTSLPFKEGETVFPEISLLTLTDMNNPYVVVSLEQSGAIKVKAGQTAVLSYETIRDQKTEGKVSSIYPKDSQFFVNIEVNSLPPGILVGMTPDVAIQVGSKDKVLQIPLKAVIQGKIKVLKGIFTRDIPVKLGISNGDWVEVTDNSLQGDETLILPK